MSSCSAAFDRLPNSAVCTNNSNSVQRSIAHSSFSFSEKEISRFSVLFYFLRAYIIPTTKNNIEKAETMRNLNEDTITQAVLARAGADVSVLVRGATLQAVRARGHCHGND